MRKEEKNKEELTEQEELLLSQDAPKESPTEEDALKEEERPTSESETKAGDVGIFVFLGIMVLLMIAAIVFVIYVCSGSATGCNCGNCK